MTELANIVEPLPSDVSLSVRGLSTFFFTYRGVVEAVRDVSFDLRRGEMLGLVGEAGAGKTVLAHSIVSQVRFPGRIVSGRVLLADHDLTALGEKELRRLRGRRIAVIGSNPGAALDPLATAGDHLRRHILAHERLSPKEIDRRVLEALTNVRIPDAKRRRDAYPHELSVGTAQRVVIALALLHSPDVIIADEPTAGLDVTVQRQALDLMKALLDDLGSATVIVTRDPGIVAHYCDRVGVMKEGHLVEETTVSDFFRGPAEAYSRALLQRTLAAEASRSTNGLAPGSGLSIRSSEPSLEEQPQAASSHAPLVSVENLVKHFPILRTRQTVKAVNGISFEVARGEALGLVGESGSGKTTVGRLILRLIEPTSGRIFFDGEDITTMAERDFRGQRSRIQMVFQEPHSSLNPQLSIGRNIAEPLIRAGKLNPAERKDRTRELLRLVQLRDHHMEMYPHNVSAGQAQRVGIARAIATNPALIVLDEPTSLLDIAVRAEILELLVRVQQETGVAYLFISHDLTAVRRVCSRIAIMYLGKIIELGASENIFQTQRHPYSKALLASVLYPDPTAVVEEFGLEGEIPSPVDLPSGCVLYSRCPIAQPDCALQHPPLEEQVPGWEVACYYTERLLRGNRESADRPLIE